MSEVRVSQQLKIGALLMVLWCSAAAGAFAQTANESREAALARGWSRLAAGQAAEAATIANGVLTRTPRDHDALSLAMSAHVAQKRPLLALDAYERWLKASGAEDVFTLEHAARGTLEEIAAGEDRGLALQALEGLVRAGVADANARLTRLRGDPAASRPEAQVETLRAAGTKGVPALRDMVREQKGPVRASALRALAAMNAQEAREDARGYLGDPDPLVRAYAAVALARFGDPDGETRVKQMLDSPVADVRLIGAEAYAGRGDGPWADTLVPLLEDPNGLNRLRAAELLAPVRPELALPVLEKAASDPNPVVRADAARILTTPSLERHAAGSLPLFRRMLRDGDPAVRLRGAVGIIGLAVR
jgi:hypothetical protein